MDSLNTPVVLFIFNRPDVTRQVFEAIAKARPSVLYIFADGPRTATEKQLTDATRQIVAEVAWPCIVFRDYSQHNMGCDPSIRRGLNQVFSKEETAIILEDDCLPDQSFFIYCEELLERYKNAQEIMHISGSNFQGDIKRDLSDYYFSKIPHCWGWATWKRAWNKYQMPDTNWKSLNIKDFKLFKLELSSKEYAYWKEYFASLIQERVTYWDLEWLFTIWKNSGVCINPNKNLVRNVGFGQQATHTHSMPDFLKNQKLEKINLTAHPNVLTINREADIFTFYQNFYSKKPNYFVILFRKLRNRIKRLYKSMTNV